VSDTEFFTLKTLTGRRNKMKKHNLSLLIATCSLLIVIACGGTPKATGADELDMAIRDASDYLNDNIPEKSKIVILNVQSDSATLSDYIIDELIANAVNDRNFSVVDRQQLDLIRQEQNFQWAGEVDDNAALEIGKFFGAQTIVSGRVSPMGSRYRLTIRALEVQTAQVQGQYNRNMDASENIVALMASGGRTQTTTASTTGQASAGGRTQAGTTTPAATPAQPVASQDIVDWARGNYSGNVVVSANSITDGRNIHITGVRTVVQQPLSGHPRLKWAYIYVGDKKYGVVWDRTTYTNSGHNGIELGMGRDARSAFDFYSGSDKDSIFYDISGEAPSIKVVKSW
jgi:TolB-like protein